MTRAAARNTVISAIATVLLLTSTGLSCSSGEPTPRSSQSPPITSSQPNSCGATCPSEASPVVTITSPQDNAKVGFNQVVRGTVTPFGGDQTLWAVVQPVASSQYHPQRGPISVGAGGGWAAVCNFGVSDAYNDGETFLLIIVVATKDAGAVFYSYLDKATAPYPGLPTLPSGAKPVAQVLVVRD